MFWKVSCQRESAVKSGTEAKAVKDRGGGDAPLKRRMRALVDLHVIFILTLPERNRIVQ